MIRFNCPNCGRLHEVHEALAKLPLICKKCGQRMTAPPPGTPPPAVPLPTPPAAPPAPSAPAAPAPVPAAAPRPPRPSVPVSKPAPPEPVVAKPAPVEPKPARPLPEDDDDDDVLVTRPDSSPDIDFNVGGPTATSLSDAARARPAGLTDASRSRPEEPAVPAGAEPDSSPDIHLDDLVPPDPEPAAPVPEPIEPELALAEEMPEDADGPPEPRSESTLLPFVADLVVFVVLVGAGAFAGERLVGKPTTEVISEAGSAAKFPPLDLILWSGPPLLLGLVYLLLNSRKRTVGAWLRRRSSGKGAVPGPKSEQEMSH